MPHTISRKLLWIYALLMVVAAVAYARFDLYMMDGDGTAFMDIAQDLNTHHASLAVNAYWNPGYPVVLAAAERLVHPTLWRELVVVRYTNVAIFVLAMAASLFFTHALATARGEGTEGETYTVSAPVLHLLGLALLTLSLGRELPVAAPRADTLLLVLLLAAGGLLLHLLRRRAAPALYLLLGLTLGLAYLTKSFAFLPSVALLAALGVGALRAQRAERAKCLIGVVLGALVFAAVAGPYIVAISRQLGHFTTGESARLNYAFFIDMTPRWHEWFHHDLGHAGGIFVHPETALVQQPPVFSFAAHPRGTFPLWFDPAWWTLGIKPHVWLKGHIYRLARNVVVFFRYLLGRPEIFVLLGVALAYGSTLRRGLRPTPRGWSSRLWCLAPIAWGLLMLAMYVPIDLQDRYLTAPLFLVVLPIFAALRLCSSAPDEMPVQATASGATAQVVASALVVLFAGIALSQAGTYVADRRRHIPIPEQRHPGYDPQMFTAAAALDQMGLHPGDAVACMGDLACYTDHYWARLAGTQILAEVETPNEANPVTEWDSIPDKTVVTAPLAHMGLRYIVSLFPNTASKPAGWVQLGGSNFFAYPLQQPVSAGEAARIAAMAPTP